jgi:hypothetical protein
LECGAFFGRGHIGCDGEGLAYGYFRGEGDAEGRAVGFYAVFEFKICGFVVDFDIGDIEEAEVG